MKDQKQQAIEIIERMIECCNGKIEKTCTLSSAMKLTASKRTLELVKRNINIEIKTNHDS